MEGIIVVKDTSLVGISVEDIVIETVQPDIEAVLTQLAFVPHYSLGRYPLFSPGSAGRLYNPFHHSLSIYKTYNID